FEHFAEPSSWALYPETIDFLAAASDLGPLAVLSNFDNRLTPILNGLGIGPFFEHIITSADARSRKPDRALFDLALDRLNCSPREAFHCGDSLHADYRAASGQGLPAFHLQRPGHTLFNFLDFCRSSTH
ncbi:MAG: HAD-IA family hydrolase, partial [Verrucomicrobiota bacterium]|nr:HAD-IA family hydrolase [Verrucomicrobiota bacterium]